MHEEQRGYTEILQPFSQCFVKQFDTFKAGKSEANTVRKYKQRCVPSRDIHGCYIHRASKILNFNGKGLTIITYLFRPRSAIETNLITNTEYRLKAHTKFTDLIQVIDLIRLANIAKSL